MSAPRFIAFSLSTLLVAGCVAGGIMNVSEPDLSSATTNIRMENGIIYLDDLSISVRPNNTDVSLLTVGVVVPVIPLPGQGARVQTQLPFQVHLEFDASRSEYFINPYKVVLTSQGIEFKPKFAFGPLKGGKPLGGRNASTLGHPWSCSYYRDMKPMPVASEQTQLVGKSCIVLEFPINTIPPSQTFDLTISGLYQHDQAIKPITLSFKEVTHGGTEVISAP